MHYLVSLPVSEAYQFSCSVVLDSATPCTAASQASLSITNPRSLFKLMEASNRTIKRQRRANSSEDGRFWNTKGFQSWHHIKQKGLKKTAVSCEGTSSESPDRREAPPHREPQPRQNTHEGCKRKELFVTTVNVKVKVAQSCPTLLVIPGTIQFMEFSRPE